MKPLNYIEFRVKYRLWRCWHYPGFMGSRPLPPRRGRLTRRRVALLAYRLLWLGHACCGSHRPGYTTAFCDWLEDGWRTRGYQHGWDTP